MLGRPGEPRNRPRPYLSQFGATLLCVARREAPMAEPGDQIAAGAEGSSYRRASHADREQVIDMLKAAFVQGRLARDEFGQRVGQALASRTYADLAVLTADIPA